MFNRDIIRFILICDILYLLGKALWSSIDLKYVVTFILAQFVIILLVQFSGVRK